jgi:hypothetical protein
MKAKLWVNHRPVELNRFVEDLVARVSVAIVSALKGTGDMQELDIALTGEEVKVAVDGREIPLNPFTTEVIASTLRGLISPLKGVDGAAQVSVSVKVD